MLRLEKEETDRKEEIKRMKVELASEIPNEPDASEADCVRVLVKLPGGQVQFYLKCLDFQSRYLLFKVHLNSQNRIFNLIPAFGAKVPAVALSQAPLLLRLLPPRVAGQLRHNNELPQNCSAVPTGAGSGHVRGNGARQVGHALRQRFGRLMSSRALMHTKPLTPCTCLYEGIMKNLR